MATALDEEKRKLAAPTVPVATEKSFHERRAERGTAFPTPFPEERKPAGLSMVAGPAAAPTVPVASLVSQIPGTTSQYKQPTQPEPRLGALDDQAASDRAAINKVGKTLANWNEKAGAAIADIGTLPVRAVAGAYDTAVVRPMRAFGLNAAYTSPMVNPASNADGQSVTPFSDQIAARQATLTPTTPTQPQLDTIQRDAIQGTRAQRDMPGASGEVIRTGQPRGSQPAQSAPAGGREIAPGVFRTDTPGQSPSFTNIGSDGKPTVASQQQSNVNVMQAGSFGLSAPQGSAGATTAQAAAPGGTLLGMNSGEARKIMQDALKRRENEPSYNYNARVNAAKAMLGIDVGERANNLDNSTSLATNAATNSTARRGQDIQAQESAARLGIDERRASSEIRDNTAKAQGNELVQSTLKQYLEAKAPESRKALADQLAILRGQSGTQQQLAWDYSPGNGMDGSGVMFNKATGESKPAGGGGQAPSTQYKVGQAISQGGQTGVVTGFDKNGEPLIQTVN